MPNNEYKVTQRVLTEPTLRLWYIGIGIGTKGPIINNQYTATMNGITEPTLNNRDMTESHVTTAPTLTNG